MQAPAVPPINPRQNWILSTTYSTSTDKVFHFSYVKPIQSNLLCILSLYICAEGVEKHAI